MPVPFSVIEPTSAERETPLIVEIPHAGLFVDGPSLALLSAPARAIGRDADLYVDELYADAAEAGATVLVSHISRYVVDLNRSEADVDADTVEGVPSTARATRGIVWRLTSDGERVLDAPLPRSELERRLETYYRPYHGALRDLVARKRARFGFAIVLAAHSMPSVGRVGHGYAKPRADVVPGTRGRSSAAAPFIRAVDTWAAATKWSVAHDDPYQGGYTTQHYGKPAENVHVVQLELSRKLYMNETNLMKNGDFATVRRLCSHLAASLGRTAPR
mgnify:CR=1 FL=1